MLLSLCVVSGAPLRNRPSQVGSSARAVGRPESTAAAIRQSQMNAKGSKTGNSMAGRPPYAKPAAPKTRMQKLAAAFALYLQVPLTPHHKTTKAQRT